MEPDTNSDEIKRLQEENEKLRAEIKRLLAIVNDDIITGPELLSDSPIVL